MTDAEEGGEEAEKGEEVVEGVEGEIKQGGDIRRGKASVLAGEGEREGPMPGPSSR